MKMINNLILALLLISSGVNAQNAKEAIQNTRQIVEGKRNLERDIKELKALQLKIVAFKKAFDIHDPSKTNMLKQDIITDMIREVKQSEAKAKQARMEIAQSSAEIRSDRREIRKDRDDSNRGRYDRRDDQKDLVRDQANKRDDKRDRRDDIRDFRAQITRAEYQASLLKELKSFNFSFDPDMIEKSIANKKLIQEFVQSLNEDIMSTKRELVEDNRERREDRRERYDDRNERNEYDFGKKRRLK
ncbi:hypothetical protein [Aquimarina macrocephali]|uniref:hypothetical protein n=1 Tax=Aquimarina macrocephali TaxID=666563 RepID=UPI0004B75E89|nr:hypothetical protein [Aquimarina macrocephali]